MDSTILNHVQIVEKALKIRAALQYSVGNVQREIIKDETGTRFLLMNVGWQPQRRVHGCTLDIRLRGDKIWIEQDNTEDGFATDLMEAGIPSSQIVLGWHPPEARKFTEFALG